jgi:hypothetical protein
MFDHMLRMDVGFYQARPSNDLIMLITQSASAARDMLNIIAMSFGRDAMTLAGLVVVMVTQDPIMSAICLVGGPFMAVAIRRLSQRIRRPWRASTTPSPPSSAPCETSGHPRRQGLPAGGHAARAHEARHRCGTADGQQDRGRSGRHEQPG